MEIAKEGELIRWELFDGIHIEPVACIDFSEKWYGVYCDYGMDKIPFELAEIVIDNVN